MGINFCIYLFRVDVRTLVPQSGPTLASVGPIGSTFAGPHSVACAEIFDEGHNGRNLE